MPHRRLSIRVAPWVVLVLGSTLLAVTFLSATNPPVFVTASVLVAAAWFGGGIVLHNLSRGHRHPLGSSIRPPTSELGAIAGGPRARYENLGFTRAYAMAGAFAVATAAFFLTGAWILSLVPWTSALVEAAAQSAAWTPLWLTVAVATLTGWGEETFFRWSLPEVWGPNGQPWALLAYTVSTVFTGNLILVFAAPILGAVCQRVLNLTGRLGTACLVHTGFSLGVVGVVPLFYAQ